MANFETDVIDAPAHWASNLINGDASGMEDAEEAECDAWSESIAKDGWSIVGCSDESHFGRFYFPVAGRELGCDLLTYQLLKEIK
jgi:hypothetical protein